MSNDEKFNQFVATEEDLKEISGNSDDTLVIPSSPPAKIETKKPEVEEVESEESDADPVLVEPAAPVAVNDKHSKEIETDYDYVRGNLYTITERSIEALENLTQIADQSQHPRAYEVVSQLVKTIADAQKDLMSLHKDKIKIEMDKAESQGGPSPDVVNNNLFVGTAAGLDEMIAKMMKKKKDA